MSVHRLVCFDIWKPWRASFWNCLINYAWRHSVYIREERHGDWKWLNLKRQFTRISSRRQCLFDIKYIVITTKNGRYNILRITIVYVFEWHEYLISRHLIWSVLCSLLYQEGSLKSIKVTLLRCLSLEYYLISHFSLSHNVFFPNYQLTKENLSPKTDNICIDCFYQQYQSMKGAKKCFQLR